MVNELEKLKVIAVSNFMLKSMKDLSQKYGIATIGQFVLKYQNDEKFAKELIESQLPVFDLLMEIENENRED